MHYMNMTSTHLSTFLLPFNFIDTIYNRHTAVDMKEEGGKSPRYICPARIVTSCGQARTAGAMYSMYACVI